MMKRILPIVLLAVILSGCWNREELNEIAIVSGIGVDKDAEKGGYRLTYQVVNPSQASKTKGSSGGASGSKAVIIYEGRGQTLFEATRRSSQKLPRRLFFSHARLLVISEQVAKRGVTDLLDFMDRNHEFRPTMQLFIAKGIKANQVLKAGAPLELVSANSIVEENRLSEKLWGNNKRVTLGQYLDIIHKPLVIPGLIGTDTGMQVSGLAIMKSQKLAGWIEEPNARGFMWAQNEITSSIVPLTCEGQDEGVSMEITRSETKMKASVSQPVPAIKIGVTVEANIGEDACGTDPTKPDAIIKLEKKLSSRIAKEIQGAVRQAKQKKSDIFGFGDAVMRENKNYWNKIKPDWDNMLPEVDVTVQVNSTIRRTGLKKSSYWKEGNS